MGLFEPARVPGLEEQLAMGLSRSIVLGVLLVSLFSSDAYTDQLVYHGVPIPVQGINPVGPASIVVQIGGSRLVVDHADAARSVIAHVLRGDNPHVILSDQEAQAILQEAERHGDTDIVAAIFSAALREIKYTILDDLANLQVVKQSSLTEEAARIALRQATSASFPARECVARFTAGDIQEQLPIPIAIDGTLCLEKIVRDLVVLMARGARIESLVSEVARAQRVFAEASLTSRQRAQSVSDALMSLSDSLKSSRIAEVLRARDVLNSHLEQQGEDLRLLWRLGVDNAFLNQALSIGRVVIACEYLSHVPFESRNQAIHEVVARIVDSRELDSELESCLRRNLALLHRYAEKDELIASRYDSLLQSLTRASLERREPDQALDVLRLGARQGICADKGRRRLLSKVYATCAREGMIPRDQALIETCSVADRAFLVMARISPGADLRYLFSVFVPIGLLIVIVVGALRSAIVHKAHDARHATCPKFLRCISELGSALLHSLSRTVPFRLPFGIGSRRVIYRDSHRPQKTTYVEAGVDASSGLSQEHLESLKAFGLRPNATLDEIKSAYRDAVKRCHPDLQKRGGEAASESFLDITKAYDYLLTWHEEKGAQRK